MSVQARGEGFRVRVRRNGRSATATFATRAEAEAFQATWIASVTRGAAPPAPPRIEPAPPLLSASVPLTVEQAAREWAGGARSGVVKTRGGRRYQGRTVETHESRLRLHVLPYLGALSVATITPGVLRRWLEELEVVASAGTARMALDSLRPVMRRLVEHERILATPCAGVRAPAPERVRPLRFLEPAEAERLRAVAALDRNPAIAAVIDLALASGARYGELAAVTWGPGGLDVEARTITIALKLDKRGEAGPPKGGRSRVVPIGPRVAARMREHRMAAGRPGDGERVFPFDLRPPWERVRVAVGLAEPSPTIHSLRHTAATWWLASGLTVHTVAELLGHANPLLVIGLYGHALPSERSSAGERLEAFLAAAAAAQI